MAGEIPQTRFADICAHSAFGPRFSGELYAADGNVGTLRTTDISADGRIEYTTMPLARLDMSKLQQHVLQEDDLVITRSGRVGTTAVFKGFRLPVLPGAFLIRFRLRRELADPRFFQYFFNSPIGQQLLRSVATGSVQQNLNITSLHRLDVPLPPLREQRAIAHILGTLDDKIQLNRRLSETLEAIARALFKSWFVDFDPVLAKAEGRPTGLPRHLDALFPDSLEESELGDVPSGWSVAPLRELCGYLSRGIGPSYTENGGICVLNQKCIRNRRVDFSQARRHDTSKKTTDSRLIQVLDVLVNSTGVGTLGRVAQVLALPEPVVVDSHVTVLRAATGIDPWFFGTALTSREADIEGLGEGSTGQTELSRARLGEMMCVVPPRELQRHFGEKVQPLFERVSSSERASQTLRALRDGLLPKLISGELRVTGAASVQENVA